MVGQFVKRMFLQWFWDILFYISNFFFVHLSRHNILVLIFKNYIIIVLIFKNILIIIIYKKFFLNKIYQEMINSSNLFQSNHFSLLYLYISIQFYNFHFIYFYVIPWIQFLKEFFTKKSRKYIAKLS